MSDPANPETLSAAVGAAAQLLGETQSMYDMVTLEIVTFASAAPENWDALGNAMGTMDRIGQRITALADVLAAISQHQPVEDWMHKARLDELKIPLADALGLEPPANPLHTNIELF